MRKETSLIICLFLLTPTFGVLVKIPIVYASANLAVIPDSWLIGDPLVAPTYLDNNVLHDGYSSVRMEKGDGSKAREIWCMDATQGHNWIQVNPGDHIFFSVWMKTNQSSINDYNITSGVRIGIDFYNGSSRINGIQSPDGSYWTEKDGFPANSYLNYVQWNSNWTLRTMDFTVQSSYPTDPYGAYFNGTLVTPDRMIPWVQVWSEENENLDEGTVWFSGSQLYINYEEPEPTHNN